VFPRPGSAGYAIAVCAYKKPSLTLAARIADVGIDSK
jgi:hypothetical protein